MNGKRRHMLLLWMDAGWTLLGLVAIVGGFMALGTDEWWIYLVLMALCGIGGSITTGFLVLAHVMQSMPKPALMVTTVGGGGGSPAVVTGTNGGGGKAYVQGQAEVTYGGAGSVWTGGHS